MYLIKQVSDQWISVRAPLTMTKHFSKKKQKPATTATVSGERFSAINIWFPLRKEIKSLAKTKTDNLFATPYQLNLMQKEKDRLQLMLTH